MVADQGVLPVRKEVVCPKDGNVKNQTCIQVVTLNLNKIVHALTLPWSHVKGNYQNNGKYEMVQILLLSDHT